MAVPTRPAKPTIARGTSAAVGRCLSMPRYQLKYICATEATEIIEAVDPDEAEDLARMRLLFSEPGLAIAIVCEGSELRRVTQGPRPALPPV
jgi:hypothetical protein